ncbi:Hsp20/alpha crystallin family protein [Pinibacter aurantiacus]|uniref:Hsp20/alpha crystallin family protein n=1 Tax=Pinibacter aurantiacus TaxID=2851599 RepID=A0A9E2S9Q1_9BACT|nr:Hsp20/alpha crystallin family protein [Pinibacter aurantiacus]MBV4359063.1 Hsp20/alpha crystallin family protein [Pinibacter aurantiacus]
MNSIIKKENGHVPAFGSVVDQIFQNNLSRFFDEGAWVNPAGGNHVPVNIRETQTHYELELVAPGLKKEDFKISIQKDLMTISFEQVASVEEQDKGWVRQEYRRQSFSRSFTLDEAVDAAKITAHYQDGILQVTLPKKEGSASVSRTIQVQ